MVPAGAADAAARVVVGVGLLLRPVPVTPLLAQLPVLELPEVVEAPAAEEPEALVQLLSSQSFSAAMARTTP